MRSCTVRGFPDHGRTTVRVTAEKHYCPDVGDPWVVLWMWQWNHVENELQRNDGISLHPKKARRLGEALVQMADQLEAEIGPRRWRYVPKGA